MILRVRCLIDIVLYEFMMEYSILGKVSFEKNILNEVTWVQMKRNGLKLCQNEDLGLNIILRPILDQK